MSNESQIVQILKDLTKPQMLRREVGPIRLSRRFGIFWDWLDTPIGERTPGLYVTCGPTGAKYEEVDHIEDITEQRSSEHTVDEISAEKAAEYLSKRNYTLENVRSVLDKYGLNLG